MLKVDPRSPAVNVEAIVKEACTAPELRQDLPELTNYVQEVLNMCFGAYA